MIVKPRFTSKLLTLTALALITSCLNSSVYAQSDEGSVFGRATAGATVTVTSPTTGVTRTTTVDPSGDFAITRLPPGLYTVTGDGNTVEVLVKIGSGSSVSLDQSIEEISIFASRQRSIDFSSTESNSVFTQEMVQQLPVPMNVNAVATLTPTVLRGDTGLGSGDLPSFAGSSVAENAYYINGFDVTNIRNFLSYADLPFEAIAQQQVKTGGYGAEYGRSLGGVVSLSTKRGTNEWAGGMSFYTMPNSLRASGKNVLSREPEEVGIYNVFSKDDQRDISTFNIRGGGALIKDKLFMFALVQREESESVNFAQSTATVQTSNTPTGLIKLDWNIADGHLLEFTNIFNKQKIELTDHVNAKSFSTELNGVGKDSWLITGGTVSIAKYTGAFTDNFTASVLVGQVEDLVGTLYGYRVQNATCPVVLDTNLAEIGCWQGPFPGGGGRLAEPPDFDKRLAARIDFEYLYGDHKFRAGVDAQEFESSEAGGSPYATGHYYRYYVVPASGTINGVAGFVPGSQFVRDRISNSTSGTFMVENTAYYVEDSWQILDPLRIYGGVRAESFTNKNGDKISFVEQKNMIAPRLGFSYEMALDNPTKLYGSLGRYFIPVASNTNIRMTRGELFVQNYHQFASRNPTTQGPVSLGPKIGVSQVVSDGSLPLPATVADTNLQPMNQDELILGVQQTLDTGWTLGAKVMYRSLNDGMDDFCGHGAFENYAKDKKYENFDSSLLAGCILMNPGNDVNLMMDIDGKGKLVAQTVPSKYFGLSKYTRTYRAVEFSFEKPFDGLWGVAGSYVYSASKGTGEGYVSSTINQDDAGVTQDFDFGSLTDGASGRLPNDREHVFKLYGNYAPVEYLQLGFNLTALSGRPLSCIGFVPPKVADFADASNYSTASSYYCLDSTGTSRLGQRGEAGKTPTTYTLDLQARHTFENMFGGGSLTVQADMFNVLNSQKPVELSEVRDFSRASSNAATGNQLSQNYGLPIAFLSPRAVRLSMRYEF